MTADGFTLSETLAALIVIGFAFTFAGQVLEQHIRVHDEIRSLQQVVQSLDIATDKVSVDLDADCIYDVLGGRCRS